MWTFDSLSCSTTNSLKYVLNKYWWKQVISIQNIVVEQQIKEKKISESYSEDAL